MPPAARITDMHTCPMVTVLVPHVGGPIIPACCPTVIISSLPAARVGDMCICTGPPDVIVKGSVTVLYRRKPGRANRRYDRAWRCDCLRCSDRYHRRVMGSSIAAAPISE